jgi:hypothetical protein
MVEKIPVNPAPTVTAPAGPLYQYAGPDYTISSGTTFSGDMQIMQLVTTSTVTTSTITM